MTLQQLRMFVAVYQERSFTAAAQRLHATQSGLSMQVKELEEHLGVQLFDRSTKGVHPTVAGDRYHRHALAVLRELDEAKRDLESLRGDDLGSVSLGLMPTFARSVLAGALADFESAHPNVRLKIIEAYSAALTEAVVREELDFAIVPPGKPDPRLRTLHVGRDRELYVTRAGGPHTHLAPVAIRDLAPLRLIVPSQANARRARLDAYLMGSGATVEALIEMDAMMGTLEVIAGGRWSAILPATVCRPDRDGSVRSLHPLADPPLWVDYVQIESAARGLTASAAAFSEIFRHHVQHSVRDWSFALGEA